MSIINKESIINTLFPLLNKKEIGIGSVVHRNGNTYYSTNSHVLVKLVLKKDEFKGQEQYIIDNKQIKELKEIGKVNTFNDFDVLERAITGEVKPLQTIFRVNSFYLSMFDKIVTKLFKGYHQCDIGQTRDEQIVLFFENDEFKLELFIMTIRK